VKIILISILAAAMVGLMVPSALADVYVHESLPPFSIQHPSGWIIQEDPDFPGVHIGSDKTGRNGLFVTLLCSEARGDDCGQVGTDYEELNFLKEDSEHDCRTLNFEESHATCDNHTIFDEFSHNLDGYTALSILTSVVLEQDANDPMFPDAGGINRLVALETYVLDGNDIWLVYIGNDLDLFSYEQAEKMLSTFKIKNIHAQEDLFVPEPTSWFDDLIKAIMSIFNF
tara:strand:- start:3 stop:686 length:684 start_codon:yes stop_codon:yes gene_type:complete